MIKYTLTGNWKYFGIIGLGEGGRNRANVIITKINT